MNNIESFKDHQPKSHEVIMFTRKRYKKQKTRLPTFTYIRFFFREKTFLNKATKQQGNEHSRIFRHKIKMIIYIHTYIPISLNKCEYEDKGKVVMMSKTRKETLFCIYNSTFSHAC